jgi:hypothetical protein
MASPWKFLSRLVPRRREPKQDDAEVAGGKPDVLALPGPPETVAEDSLDASSAHVDADLPPAEISNPASIETPTIESALGEADDMPANVVADVVAGDLTPSDLLDTVSILSPDSADVQLRGETKPRKQLGQTRRPKLTDTEQVPRDRSIPSNDTLSLDDEIRLLRGQLAKKLRLQNAQLRKMLERFKR